MRLGEPWEVVLVGKRLRKGMIDMFVDLEIGS